jgi:hypothetical protein
MEYSTSRLKKKNLKLRGLSPQANYTDRATAADGEVVPTSRLHEQKQKRIVVREGGSTFISERSLYSIQMMQGSEAITTCQVT